MTQYHVTTTTVTDTAEHAAELVAAAGRRAVAIRDLLERVGVTHLGTSITAIGGTAEEPTTRDRIDALIDYLGEDQALRSLEVAASWSGEKPKDPGDRQLTGYESARIALDMRNQRERDVAETELSAALLEDTDAG